MKRVILLLSKQQPKTFKVSYSSDYKLFTLQRIVADKLHPLHETQKRRQAARKKEGLWWHATTSVDLSKSSCVRAWARRRLCNAVRDELHQRGFDATGRFVNVQAIQARSDLLAILQQGKSLDLVGSLRLHSQPPILPASYAQIREETGQLIEILLQGVKNEAGGQASMRKTSDRTSRSTVSTAVPNAQVKKMRSDQRQGPS